MRNIIYFSHVVGRLVGWWTLGWSKGVRVGKSEFGGAGESTESLWGLGLVVLVNVPHPFPKS
jgi:hypothetical protein